jgi:anti-sigma factor RsiW
MKCDVIAEVEALHDGALAPLDETRVRAHLTQCSDCLNALHSLEALRALVRTIPMPTPSRRLDHNVARSFEQHHGTARRTSWLIGSVSVPRLVLAAAAVAIIAVLGGMSVWINGRMSAPPRVERVQVPVYVDRVVTRTVYVERNGDNALHSVKSRTAHRPASHSGVNLTARVAAMSNSYVTRANLAGFEPPAEITPRIFRETNNE